MFRREADFYEYGYSLAQSIFADTVIWAIARFEENRDLELGERESEALVKAKQFFSKIVEAKHLFESGLSSEQDLEIAKLLDRVMRSTSTSSESVEDFVQNVEQLRNTIECIISGSQAEEQEVRDLKSFFYSYGAQQFQQAQSFMRQ